MRTIAPASRRPALTLAATTVAALAAVAPAASALAPGSAHAAAAAAPVAPAGASAVVGQLGLQVVGGDRANDLALSIAGGRFRVTDDAAISAGAGCAVIDVPGPRFGVSCRIVRTSSGQIMSARFDTGAGDDSFDNLSSAPVRVQGGDGDDELKGGPKGDLLSDFAGSNRLFGRNGPDTLSGDFGNDAASDSYFGGAGDDDIRAGDGDDLILGGADNDTMRGGDGGDTFNGADGDEDAVVYLENGRDVGVFVTIDDQADDGERFAEEGDNVLTSVEEVFGTHEDDIILGSDGDDRLEGNLGNDALAGQKGADDIDGGPGDDQLASNAFFGVPVADGEIDALDGSTGTDRCRIPFEIVEDDATTSCELINED